MAKAQRPENDNIEALELLRGASDKKRPATPTRPPQPPPPPAIAPPRAGPPPAEIDEPPYRCLHCGYPIAAGDCPRCSECGRTYDADVLRRWFDGDEQRRFEHVVWLVLAVLFLKLLLLPELLWVSRLGTVAVLGWAGVVALRGKQNSIGGHYAVGVLVVAGLMLLVSWGVPLAFYTLDTIAGCLLLLAMLHDPEVGPVCGTSGGRRIAPLLLFIAPVFAIGCYFAERMLMHSFVFPALAPGTPASLAAIYTPFGFILPYLAAAAMWVFVWRALAGAQQTLFGKMTQA